MISCHINAKRRQAVRRSDHQAITTLQQCMQQESEWIRAQQVALALPCVVPCCRGELLTADSRARRSELHDLANAAGTHART
eukprot:6212724-Pleurochrysis_carterae.AAC.3